MRSTIIDRKIYFTPLYMELKVKLENEILSNKLSDGSFFCTLKEICDKYNVSITTARKAIDALVKTGIARSKSSRGIFVADTNKLLDLKSLRNFILILHAHEEGSQSIYFSLRLGSLLQTFSESGITAKVIFTDTHSFHELNIPSEALKGIVASSSIPQEQIIYYSQKAPTLLLGNNNNEIKEAYSVAFDDIEVVRLAKKYFHSNKINEIVLIGPSDDIIERYSLLFKKQSDIKFSMLKVNEPSVKCGREIVPTLARFPAATGFVAGDDFLAVGIVEGFLKMGRDIRDEKRIIAFANPKFPFTQQLAIPAIGYDPWLVGKTAAEFLCKIIKNENPDNHKTLTIEPEISI